MPGHALFVPCAMRRVVSAVGAYIQQNINARAQLKPSELDLLLSGFESNGIRTIHSCISTDLSRELLFLASKMNDLELVKLLLETLALQTQQFTLLRIRDGSTGFLPWHHVCRSGHYELAEYLLGLYPILLTQRTAGSGVDGENGLHIVCRYGYSRLVSLFLNHACKNMANAKEFIDEVTNKNFTALQLAMHHKHVDIVLQFLDYYKLVHVHGQNGNMHHGREALISHFMEPVFWAAKNGHLEVFTALFSQSKKATYKCKPLSHKEVSRVLLTREVRRETDIGFGMGAFPLWLAVENGHIHIAELLMSLEKTSICLILNQHTRMNVLHLACLLGNLDITQGIHAANKRASFMCTGDLLDQSTPIHLACLYGHLKIFETLCCSSLERFRQCVKLKNLNGLTPLHLVFLRGHLLMADKIRQFSDEAFFESLLTSKDYSGRTVFYFSMVEGSSYVKKIVADWFMKHLPNLMDPLSSLLTGGLPLLHFACLQVDMHLVRLLLPHHVHYLDHPNINMIDVDLFCDRAREHELKNHLDNLCDPSSVDAGLVQVPAVLTVSEVTLVSNRGHDFSNPLHLLCSRPIPNDVIQDRSQLERFTFRQRRIAERLLWSNPALVYQLDLHGNCPINYACNHGLDDLIGHLLKLSPFAIHHSLAMKTENDELKSTLRELPVVNWHRQIGLYAEKAQIDFVYWTLINDEDLDGIFRSTPCHTTLNIFRVDLRQQTMVLFHECELHSAYPKEFILLNLRGMDEEAYEMYRADRLEAARSLQN